MTVSLRPATEADLDFMRVLYHSTRAEEMRHFPFNEDQKRAFLDSQFAAQTAHYAAHYPACRRQIIEREGFPVGRLLVDRWDGEVRVVDIALLEVERGRGTGTALLRAVMDEAAEARLPVTIHVEAFNRARRLYERLGFREIGTNGVYHLMRWEPEAAG